MSLAFDLARFILDSKSEACSVCRADGVVYIGTLHNGRLTARCDRHAGALARVLVVATAVEGEPPALRQAVDAAMAEAASATKH